MSVHDTIPLNRLEEHDEQINVLKYMVKQLEKCIEEQRRYTKLDGSDYEYNEMYGIHVPYKTDIVRNCDVMRKILLDIKNYYI